MKWLFVLLAVVAVALAHEGHDHAHGGDAAGAVDESDVLVLTKANWSETLEKNDLVLVEFYAPWCGHCKALKPEWAKAATMLKGEAGIVVGKVDATIEKELAEKFEIKGFPTIKLFRGAASEPKDYEGERHAEDIVAYLRRQAGPASKSVNTAEELAAFIDSSDVTVVGFFPAANAEYTAIANTLRDEFAFAETTSAELAAAQEASIPSVIVYRKFDEPKLAYTGSLDGLAAFIAANSLPVVAELGPENFSAYRKRNMPLFWSFIDPADTDKTDAHKALLKEVAAPYKEKISTVYLDGTRYGRQAEALGLSGKVFPSLVILEADFETKYIFPESNEVTVASVGQWLADFAAGKLLPHVKSEPEPEDNNGPVKILVATNFDRIVNDPTKDVLIEFYAPWCGHCKNLAPIYEQLGAAYKDSNVVIAKMDATANDPPKGFEVTGFPTLFFVKAGDKTPQPYSGGRKLDDLKAFLEKNKTGGSAAPAAEKPEEPHIEL
jgi:protein disulfide-isomerase A1